MAVTSSSKWSCPTCTYNNWQSWSKCVLCGTSKPSDDVIPRTPVAKYRQQNPSWSKLGSSHLGGVGATLSPGSKCQDVNIASLVDASHGNTSTQQQVYKGSSKCKTKGKWVCGSCTYLNWPNTSQCTMCGVLRTRMTRNESPIWNEAGRMPSRSSESILRYASGVGAVGGAAVSVGGYSDVPLHPAKGKNGRHSNRGGQSVGENKKKWKCHRCTYENWQRASKCTMCMGPKTRTPSPPLSGTEDPAHMTPPLSSPHSVHSRSSQVHHPTPHLPATLPNSNASLIALSPVVSRAHPNSNDPCETHSNGSNANEPLSGSNMQPGKDILAESGSSSCRDRRISYGSDSHNSIPRQIQLKSDSDEVCMA